MQSKVSTKIVLCVGLVLIIFSVFFVRRVYHIAQDISYEQAMLKAQSIDATH